jgi:hypothetical protein
MKPKQPIQKIRYLLIFFIGPLKDPIKNIWVIELGMIACFLVIPWAFIFGAFRGIPLFWR